MFSFSYHFISSFFVNLSFIKSFSLVFYYDFQCDVRFSDKLTHTHTHGHTNERKKTFNLQLVLTTWVKRNGILKQLSFAQLNITARGFQSKWIEQNKMKLARFHKLLRWLSVHIYVFFVAFLPNRTKETFESMEFQHFWEMKRAKANARLMHDAIFIFSSFPLSIWSNPW